MRIHLIETGTVRIKTAQIAARRPAPLSLIDVFTDPTWSGWVPTYATAIETDEGVIVVDTGQASYLLEEMQHSPHPFIRGNAGFRITPEQEIGPQLMALGIGPRDVTKVVLTHMHIDHDAGLMHFPHSQIFAAPGEVAKARGVMGMVRGYLPQRWPSWFDPAALVLDDGAYGPFRASKRLTRDGRVIAVATPGHTPNHVSVIVEDDDAAIFLAGDTSYTEATMLAGQADGVSPDQAVTRETLTAIRQFASTRPTVYLPAHDPDGAARFARRQAVPVAMGKAA
jgi:glyoxylase-like metal-dependent hydrolase (beta-lactamase superfamily II)